MKKIFKCFLIALVTGLSLTLCACGPANNNEGNNNTGDNNGNQVETIKNKVYEFKSDIDTLIEEIAFESMAELSENHTDLQLCYNLILDVDMFEFMYEELKTNIEAKSEELNINGLEYQTSANCPNLIVTYSVK